MRLIDADKLKQAIAPIAQDHLGEKVKEVFDHVIDQQATIDPLHSVYMRIIKMMAETTNDFKHCHTTADKSANLARYNALMDALDEIDEMIVENRKGNTK
jgi:hypothetical protein